MAKLTEVGVASGIPNAGSGTASTLDGIFNRDAGPVILTTAAAVTAGSQAFPVAFPATGQTLVVTQPTAANLLVTVATGSTFSTAAIFPVGPIRAQKGFNVVTIATTTETVIATAVASTQLDLYGLVLANTSATASLVTINQATAGIPIAQFQVPAGDTRGFMLPAGSAIAMATAGNNLTAVLGTSISGIRVTALYVKN